MGRYVRRSKRVPIGARVFETLDGGVVDGRVMRAGVRRCAVRLDTKKLNWPGLKRFVRTRFHHQSLTVIRGARG